jgi:FAD dependent oxidoreductase
VIDATGDADVAARAGAPYHKTPKENMMAASVMFSMAGVNKRRFMDQVKADPQTYMDWVGNGEWNITTTGKEDDMFSPFLWPSSSTLVRSTACGFGSGSDCKGLARAPSQRVNRNPGRRLVALVRRMARLNKR